MSGQQDVLTFGHLARVGIELRMMTTNITRHQPLAMPWATQEYFFDPDEMRRLFPEDIVRWMEDHPPVTDVGGNPLPRAKFAAEIYCVPKRCRVVPSRHHTTFPWSSRRG
jgi:hypothetical protein